jgi:hypothetical protein
MGIINKVRGIADAINGIGNEHVLLRRRGRAPQWCPSMT